MLRAMAGVRSSAPDVGSVDNYGYGAGVAQLTAGKAQEARQCWPTSSLSQPSLGATKSAASPADLASLALQP